MIITIICVLMIIIGLIAIKIDKYGDLDLDLHIGKQPVDSFLIGVE